MRDPRIQQTLNQVSRNIEHATDSARAGCFAFTQSYLEPCFESLAACCPSPQRVCPCCYTDIPRRRRNRNRPEYPFDFYNSDYDEDDRTTDFLGWGNDELDRLLAGSGAHRQRLNSSDGRGGGNVPGGRNEGMYYTRGGQRRRRKTLPHDGVDPTIIPNTSALGFLSIFGWRPTLRYKPSAADLQDNPGGYGGVGGAFAGDGGGPQFAEDGDDSEREALLSVNRDAAGKGSVTPSKQIKDGNGKGRKRSGTNSSNDTTDTFRSRADLIGSDDDADAVPLDDEFANALALGSGPSSSRKNLFRMGRRSRTNESDSLSAMAAEQRSISSGGTGGSVGGAGTSGRKTPLSDRFKIEDEADDESGASLSISGPQSDEELRMEEEAARREEEEDIKQKRLAARKLAIQKGLSASTSPSSLRPRVVIDRSDSNPSSTSGLVSGSVVSPLTPPNEPAPTTADMHASILVGSPEQIQPNASPPGVDDEHPSHPDTIPEALESESTEQLAISEAPIELQEEEPLASAPPPSATLLADDEMSSGSEDEDDQDDVLSNASEPLTPAKEEQEDDCDEANEERVEDQVSTRTDNNVTTNPRMDEMLHEQEYKPRSNVSSNASSLNRLRFDRFISATFSAAADAEVQVTVSSDSETSPQQAPRPSNALSKSSSEPVLATSFLASYLGIKDNNNQGTAIVDKKEFLTPLIPSQQTVNGKATLESPISIRSMPAPTISISNAGDESPTKGVRLGAEPRHVVDGNLHPAVPLGATATVGVGGMWGRLGSWFSPASVAAAQSFLRSASQPDLLQSHREHAEKKDDEDDEQEDHEHHNPYSLLRRRSDAGWESMDEEEGMVERWKETMEVWTEDEDDDHDHTFEKRKESPKRYNKSHRRGSGTASGHTHATFPFRYSPTKKRGQRPALRIGKIKTEFAAPATGPAADNRAASVGSPEDDLD